MLINMKEVQNYKSLSFKMELNDVLQFYPTKSEIWKKIYKSGMKSIMIIRLSTQKKLTL